MKKIKLNEIDKVPGRRLKPGEKFTFSCHPEIACFNLCCRNLNLFLYPYDVIRLKNSLKISSDEFLDNYVDIVLRPGNFFPEILLKMKEDKEKTCIFLTEKGCSVYEDRPGTCRAFPMENGIIFDDESRQGEIIFFFRPPDFCLGKYEDKKWTPETWATGQDASVYNKMTVEWAKIKSLFTNDPWQGEGPSGPRAKMAFMASYNIDTFRDFIFGSSFLKRYKIKKNFKVKIKKNDAMLLNLGFDWIKFYLWGQKPGYFKVKK